MDDAVKDRYRSINRRRIYEASYYELASEALKGRWQLLDSVATLFAVVMATGSAVFGWLLWSDPDWRNYWGMVAGLASIASISLLALGVPGKIQGLEELRRVYSALRIDFETFRDNLEIGLDESTAHERLQELSKKLKECADRPRYDAYLFTSKFKTNIESQVLNRMPQ